VSFQREPIPVPARRDDLSHIWERQPPESVAREKFIVPIADRHDFLIVGMVHPVLDIVENVRFILIEKYLV
jgi:hypothetical protein